MHTEGMNENEPSSMSHNKSNEDDKDGECHDEIITNQATTTIINQEEYSTCTKHLAPFTIENRQHVIADSGADCHVGEKHWLPLTPIDGPHVQHVNVNVLDNQEARKKQFPIFAAITKILLYSHCALMIFATILTVDEKIKITDIRVMHLNNTLYNDNHITIPTPISSPFMDTNITNHLGEPIEPIAHDLQQEGFLDNQHEIIGDL